jgi:hypothetical protein
MSPDLLIFTFGLGHKGMPPFWEGPGIKSGFWSDSSRQPKPRLILLDGPSKQGPRFR